MKIEKKEKGWILESLEKKNECLDVDSFGGENPEDVEKQREENAKEINKRFKKTEENGKKVTGEDFVESIVNESKEFKKEERKELGAFIEELKKQGIKHTISRSANEGYRWNVSYEKTIKTPLEESRGGFVKEYNGCKIIETPNVYVCTNEHGLNIGQSKTIPGCEGIIDEYIRRKNKKECKEEVVEEELLTLNEEPDKHAQTIQDRHGDDSDFIDMERLESLVYQALSGVILATNYKGKEVKLDDLEHATEFALTHLPDEFEFEECLHEDVEDELPDVVPEEPIVVSTEVPEEELPVIEEPTEEVVDNGIYLALSSELRDTLQDIENLKGLTVTLASEEDKQEVIDELNTIIDDRTIHVGTLQGLMEKVDSKIEPEVEETHEEEVVEENLNIYVAPTLETTNLNEEVQEENK